MRERSLNFSARLAIAGLIVICGCGQASWQVPDDYKALKNPAISDKSGLESGALLYSKYCATCHGKKGFGDGLKSEALTTTPGDLSGKEFQKQSDGEHFYKTKTGRGEMPGYSKVLTDKEIWNLVNYMRTFRK